MQPANTNSHLVWKQLPCSKFLLFLMWYTCSKHFTSPILPVVGSRYSLNLDLQYPSISQCLYFVRAIDIGVTNVVCLCCMWITRKTLLCCLTMQPIGDLKLLTLVEISQFGVEFPFLNHALFNDWRLLETMGPKKLFLLYHGGVCCRSQPWRRSLKIFFVLENPLWRSLKIFRILSEYCFVRILKLSIVFVPCSPLHSASHSWYDAEGFTVYQMLLRQITRQ